MAVIGGGIAGAACALRLSQGGARPLWIAPDRPEFIPGEHLGAAALPLLAQLGVSDAVLGAEVHRHAHATYSAWGSDVLMERNAIVHLEGPPTVLDRRAFEDALAARVDMERLPEVVRDARIQDGHWVISVGDTTHRARFLFDATGRRALIASRDAARFQADKLACSWQLFSCAPNTRPVTLIEAAEGGWWYLSKLAGDRVIVNFYTDADLPFARDLTSAPPAVAAYLADQEARPLGGAKRVSCNSTWLAPAIGPGWAAIGDAAAAFDPLSSHGMTTALWTALKAADAYLARDRAAMQDYATSVAKGVQDYLEARRRMYAQEGRWPDAPFWARRIRVPELAPRP